MPNLLDHILNGNYVSANELFEERMVELQEQKIYETKQMVAAEMNEVFISKDTKEKLKKGYRIITSKERQQLRILPKGEREKKVPRDVSAIAPEKVGVKPKKPGIVRRNVNTFLGREPDYQAKKEPSKGGRAGKFARKALQVAAGVLQSAE